MHLRTSPQCSRPQQGLIKYRRFLRVLKLIFAETGSGETFSRLQAPLALDWISKPFSGSILVHKDGQQNGGDFYARSTLRAVACLRSLLLISSSDGLSQQASHVYEADRSCPRTQVDR